MVRVQTLFLFFPGLKTWVDLWLDSNRLISYLKYKHTSMTSNSSCNAQENLILGEMFLTGAQTILETKSFKLYLAVVQNFQRFTYLFPLTAVLNLKGRCCTLEYQHKFPERLNLTCDKLVYVYCIFALCIWKKLVLKPQSRTESLKAFTKATITREQIMKLRLHKVFILDLIHYPICVMFLRHSCLK